jgi:tetratricopeptide (TPR) repeat protein
MAKKVDKTDKQMMAVEEALSKTEVFIEKNQRILLIVIGAIVVLVLGFYGYKRMYVAPMEKEAQAQMFMAERYFEIDSLNLALYGDGNYLGFIDIIEEYGVTKSANLAKYYTGISYLRQGDFDQAIEYLDDFDKKDQIVGPMAYGAMADAYLELDQPEEAASYYLEAANFTTNDFTTPMYLMRAGWTYEILGEYDKALEAYERIRLEFPRSLQSPEIDKYTERARILAEQE